MEEGLRRILEGSMLLLGVGMILALIRSIRGPRFTDRIAAVNLIGTMATAFICILSVYLDEAMLLDGALVYALLSFLAVVIVARLVLLKRRGMPGQKKQRGGSRHV